MLWKSAPEHRHCVWTKAVTFQIFSAAFIRQNTTRLRATNLARPRPLWMSLTAWWWMCKRAYSPTIALKIGLVRGRDDRNYKMFVSGRFSLFWWIDFFPGISLSLCEVMNGWLMWRGHGANQFVVTRVVAVTLKARRVGATSEGWTGGQGPAGAAPAPQGHLHFQFLLFLLIEQEEVVGQSLFHE